MRKPWGANRRGSPIAARGGSRCSFVPTPRCGRPEFGEDVRDRRHRSLVRAEPTTGSIRQIRVPPGLRGCFVTKGRAFRRSFPAMSLPRCRVVLVRPKIAANLGATARVMGNMGLAELVLVAPAADPAEPRPRQLATHGEVILDRARVVADLGDAVADCQLVAATSARTGGRFRRQDVRPPEAISPLLIEAMAAGPVALVF